MRAYAGLLAVLALGLAAGTTACSGHTLVYTPTPANPLDPESVNALLAVNGYRTGKGLAAVVNCPSLNVSSAAHADDMRDNGYLSDTGLDNSTPAQRDCTAGYTPACGSLAVAELVASGLPDGSGTEAQWQNDAKASGLLSDPRFKVSGIGRSIGGMEPTWSLDLADGACP